jgi:hypothetical protein
MVLRWGRRIRLQPFDEVGHDISPLNGNNDDGDEIVKGHGHLGGSQSHGIPPNPEDLDDSRDSGPRIGLRDNDPKMEETGPSWSDICHDWVQDVRRNPPNIPSITCTSLMLTVTLLGQE